MVAGTSGTCHSMRSVASPESGKRFFSRTRPEAYKRHSVVSVVYLFVQRAGPEGATGISVRGDYQSMYARLFDVIVTIR